VEQRILKHYGQIAGNAAPVPSLLLLQAPIFHGHAFAIHLELERTADLAVLSQAMAGEYVNVVRPAEDAPSNVNAAGQPNIQLALLADANSAHGVWLWAAADNLRIAATTAVECAEAMAASRPRGQIQ
jgi:aspartate-semialdehyde dehydrogenase